MCKALLNLFSPGNKTNNTLEEIIAANSKSMSDSQKSEYWYEISQTAFRLLGKIDIPLSTITPTAFANIIRASYPTIENVKFADSEFYVTTLDNIKLILKRDWTNLVPYIIDKSDCDKFANRLYSHLADYYGLNTVIPVWGDTSGGYHAFNLVVYTDAVGKLDAQLIEPQRDEIFRINGPLGHHIPRKIAEELGVMKINIDGG